jgi:hypothetical protein
MAIHLLGETRESRIIEKVPYSCEQIFSSLIEDGVLSIRSMRCEQGLAANT